MTTDTDMTILEQSRLRCGFSEAMKGRLITCLSEYWRHYHTVEHVADLLTKFDPVRHLAECPLAVEKAIWFHDIVYIPGRDDNEDRSVEAARWALVGDPDLDRVLEMLHATRWHSGETPDEILLCDLDLSILGDPPDKYERFEDGIRREYSLLPPHVFRKGRSDFLRNFIERPRIYRTSFGIPLEAPARENIERTLRELG